MTNIQINMENLEFLKILVAGFMAFSLFISTIGFIVWIFRESKADRIGCDRKLNDRIESICRETTYRVIEEALAKYGNDKGNERAN